jgi:hypothetical protein
MVVFSDREGFAIASNLVPVGPLLGHGSLTYLGQRSLHSPCCPRRRASSKGKSRKCPRGRANPQGH